MVDKLDLVKQDKKYYKAGNKPEVVNINACQYLTIEGSGAPGNEEFVEKVAALYPLAYGVKKLCKQQEQDFAVPKLEGLWWVVGNKDAVKTPREQWCWKLLIRMPDFVIKNDVATAKQEVKKKKDNPYIDSVELVAIKEGKCAQVMHTGPYSEEAQTISSLMDYIDSNKLKVNGLHHEIYLSDPNKTAPEKMKTIIRYPVS